MFWLKQAAMQNYRNALFGLGSIYFEGLGVPKNYKESALYFEKVANLGCPDAQAILGAMYYEGLGVVQDDKNAVKWFKKSADQGNHEALRYLLTLCFERPHLCQ